MLRLREGNKRFVEGLSTVPSLSAGTRRTLAAGQHPFAIVVTCADSRVPPEHIFNAGLGELFVIRNAGNVCDPETLASIEYAATHLGAEILVVMAHTSCGAVRAACEGAHGSEALTHLLDRIRPAARAAHHEGLRGRDLHDRVEVENAHETMAQILKRSPVLCELTASGKLELAPARYRLDTGAVEWLELRKHDVAAPPKEDHGHRLQEVAGMPPHVAFGMLQAGHRRFLSDSPPSANLAPSRRESLTSGQRPFAVVVTCADSRLAPEHIFDTGLGELFVLRVAGNVLNDEIQGSIEYAVEHLGASLVVVLGHTKCGAVTAACEHAGSADVSPSMRSLLNRLEPAVKAAHGSSAKGRDLVELAIAANTRLFLGQLRQRSILVQDLEARGGLYLVPAVYDLTSGDIRYLQAQGETATPMPMGESKAQPDHHSNDPHPQADGHGHGSTDHEATAKVPAAGKAHEPVGHASPAHSNHHEGHGTPHTHSATIAKPAKRTGTSTSHSSAVGHTATKPAPTSNNWIAIIGATAGLTGAAVIYFYSRRRRATVPA